MKNKADDNQNRLPQTDSEEDRSNHAWYKDPWWWFIGLAVLGMIIYTGCGELIFQGLLVVIAFIILVFVFSIKGGLIKKLFLLVSATLVFSSLLPLFRIKKPVSEQAVISYPTTVAKTGSDKITPTESTKKLDKKTYPTIESTKEPEETADIISESDPYSTMSKIGKDVAGDNSNVSVLKNSDGSIDVINNIQSTPEISWGLDTYTRKWVTDFLSQSYTSGLKIRYVLVTVSFLNSGRPATRVGLGVNQASKYTDSEWNQITPYDLCNWLSRIQIGDNVDSSNPSYNPSGWAFAKNYKCN